MICPIEIASEVSAFRAARVGEQSGTRDSPPGEPSVFPPRNKKEGAAKYRPSVLSTSVLPATPAPTAPPPRKPQSRPPASASPPLSAANATPLYKARTSPPSASDTAQCFPAPPPSRPE